MVNKYFPDEQIEINDLFFMCYMIERVARKIHQHNNYVVNKIGKEELYHLISVASVLHCENPMEVEERWIEEYGLQNGEFDITDVRNEFVERIPLETQMGKVYQRLIIDTANPKENYVEGIIRIYNNAICEIIDNYECSAYYEPSYVIARAYFNGGF